MAPIKFTLVVDNFGVKCVGKKHAEHLEALLRSAGYRIKSDWSGTKYIGITLAGIMKIFGGMYQCRDTKKGA